MSTDINIGYWGSDFYPDLPMPVADTELPDQAAVIERLKAAFLSGYLVSYRGASTCRICGQMNGYEELEIIKGSTKYRIPDGYLHYLTDHRVGYDPRLLEALS